MPRAQRFDPVHSALATVAALAALIAPACGGSTAIDGAPSDASTEVATPISADAGLDASALDLDAGDAAAAVDAVEAATPADLLAPCSVARDVFYYDVLPVDAGYRPYEVGAQTFTNLNASWTASDTSSLEIYASPGGGVDIWTPFGVPVTPGTYTLQPSNPNAYPALDLVIGDEGGNVSGTLTIVDFTTTVDDAGTVHPATFLASFDVVSVGVPIRGCMRYAVSP